MNNVYIWGDRDTERERDTGRQRQRDIDHNPRQLDKQM